MVTILLAIVTTVAVIVVPPLINSQESPAEPGAVGGQAQPQLTATIEPIELSPRPEVSPTPTAPIEHSTSEMSQARANFSLFLLPNGRVLAVGSHESSDSEEVKSTEIYDPSTGEWLGTGSMNERRLVAPAVQLQDGTVLIAGGSEVDITQLSGYDTFPTPLRSAEVYDPDLGQWITTGSMRARRYLHTLSLLSDGRVLAVGGQGGSWSAEIYDPRTGGWEAITGPGLGDQWGFMGHVAVTLTDGRVLVAGGKDTPVEGWGDIFDEAAIYDPAADEWTAAAKMVIDAERAVAVLLADGRVLVTGGRTDLPSPGIAQVSDVAQIYDPVSDRWELTGSMNVPRVRHTAVLLHDGRVLVAGGLSPKSPEHSGLRVPTDSVEIYDPEQGTWSVAKKMIWPRANHAAVALPDGNVLIAGSVSPIAARVAELYSP